MKMTMISSPTAPAMRLRCTVCWPRVALTSLLCTVAISAGSAPADTSLASCCAWALVKLPVICVWLLDAPCTFGAVITSLSRKMATRFSGEVAPAANAAVVILLHSLAPVSLNVMLTVI
jgi:hypothetical protein